MRILLLLVVVWLVAQVWSKPYQTPMMGEAGGSRTLVILNDMSIVQTHSLFFGGLSRLGHEITYQDPSAVKLSKFGESSYDNVVVFSPEIDDIVEDLLEFMNKGGNIMVAADDSIGGSLREFAESCGVEFDADGSSVVDHFSFSERNDKERTHTAILTDNVFDSGSMLENFGGVSSGARKVLYRGIGHAVDESNVLAVRVLKGGATTYSADPTRSVGEYPENAGADTLLVTAMQGRNNARVTFSGSLDMFSNEYFVSEGSANDEFCSDVAAWTFGQMGVLRFRDVIHTKSDGTPPDVILHEKDRPNDLPTSLYVLCSIALPSFLFLCLLFIYLLLPACIL
jgi:oligosaccharyltransferase complex subunit beta